MLAKKDFDKWCEHTLARWIYQNREAWEDETWRYFSPHLQKDFPREAITTVIKDLIRCILENAEHMKSDKVMDTLLSVDVIQNNAEKTIITHKRLWNGEACPPCGGSGVKHFLGTFPYRPCPDCTPDLSQPRGVCKGIYTDNEGRLRKDERGPERRQVPADRRYFANRRHDPDHGRTYATQRGGRRANNERRKCSPPDDLN